MTQNKKRLDILLTEKGLVESREKARAIIMSGIVYVDEKKVDKPGTKVDAESSIEIRGNTLPYVSRGGLKLAKAMEFFNIDLHGMIAADIGASTGGFTDCMLQNGAMKVYAIDVGYGQLAWKLRNDNRVIVMERTNIRYVTPDMVPDRLDFASIDVSFISLKKVLPAVLLLLKESSRLVCLIKPQFEAGKENVGKKGVVRDKNVHIQVITDICDFCQMELKLKVGGLTYSPIKGPEGNIEYLILLVKSSESFIMNELNDEIKRVVMEAHEYFK
ncbi:TlyA family RNA methyltransferase [Lutispora thermophila]|uniref:23S rRNA (Cytidine1920-2'-O)/16S rRNA (Cytidine1409-2'-O)-methyltransferase n=1 Tax=Lutispora thermophila DSM 19022 TaxID=1122184 RepID=A0A1M6F5Q7_9FIRM|nr:TlyA family RNA methyltransferase [Lutispora thermophila]SHI93064.1 23S rRNA (cytidine1920-2'-O)/16S rRNA (cytidine1409-2'-O)-methyltransferase [Lutispora thermophila DSM 19022]